MAIGIIDFLIVAVIALITWCVASEGAVEAGTTFFAAVLSGLLAMNFFEPLADLLDDMSFVGDRADMLALLGLFGVLLTLMRFGAEYLAPTFIGLQGIAYDIGRWGFAFLTAYTTAAILLTALHTAPLPREFWGFQPERNNLFNVVAPDRQWLGFVQYVTEKPFSRTQRIDDPRFGLLSVPRIFDGRTAYHWGLDALGSAKVEAEARRASTTGGAPNARELAEAATRIVIPSFLARYADRREQFGGGGEVIQAAPAAGTGSAPAGGPQF
ncbi:MAG: CvpA family protein [Planctomycetota bacterium]|nr:CvpA family protein [Planctomycetaceae bacterium]MDQ3330805.1 CvpA family protein [Planctomycetota bacterium]